MAKGEIVGRGRTAEVYIWEETQVLKLFVKEFPIELIEKEFLINNLIEKSGFVIPAARNRVKIDGRQGILYERIDGPDMYTLSLRQPWSFIQLAFKMAQLHATMHKHIIHELPSQQNQLEQAIAEASCFLTKNQIEITHQILKELPIGEVLCHGDFHPGNIMMSSQKSIPIDWTSASTGNPIADVARTSLILSLGEIPPEAPRHTRLMILSGRWLFRKIYLKRYFQIRPDHQEQLSLWMLPVAVARFSDGIISEQKQLHLFIEEWFCSFQSKKAKIQ